MVMISWIYHLPIQHRKALLDACRIRAPVWQNKTLSATFAALPPVPVYTLQSVLALQLTAQDLASKFDRICLFPLLCSLLSYTVRAEGTIYTNEFLAEKDRNLSTRNCRQRYSTNRWMQNSTTLIIGSDKRTPSPAVTWGDRLAIEVTLQ
jgi:hypothetical protein